MGGTTASCNNSAKVSNANAEVANCEPVTVDSDPVLLSKIEKTNSKDEVISIGSLSNSDEIRPCKANNDKSKLTIQFLLVQLKKQLVLRLNLLI